MLSLLLYEIMSDLFFHIYFLRQGCKLITQVVPTPSEICWFTSRWLKSSHLIFIMILAVSQSPPMPGSDPLPPPRSQPSVCLSVALRWCHKSALCQVTGGHTHWPRPRRPIHGMLLLLEERLPKHTSLLGLVSEFGVGHAAHSGRHKKQKARLSVSWL